MAQAVETEAVGDAQADSAAKRRIWRRWLILLAIALLVLLLKAWIVAGMVQDEAQRLAADAAGLPVERVEMVDGLDVRLTGFADAASRDAAVAAVDALDSSWEVEGVLAGAASDGERDDAADGDSGAATDGDDAGGSEEADESAAGPSTSVVVALEEMALTLSAGPTEVVLSGVVRDRSVADALVAAAAESFGDREVVDELTVDPSIEATGGTVSVVGEATTDDQRAEWIAAADLVAAEADLDVDDQGVSVVAVEAQLNALFELDPIEFDYRSATIRDASTLILDEAAELIVANPEAGRLRVVGHTDSDGPADRNQELSLARADSVVDYLVSTGGVDPARLESEGRGETELAVDPDLSEADKQRNRRIEWELIE